MQEVLQEFKTDLFSFELTDSYLEKEAGCEKRDYVIGKCSKVHRGSVRAPVKSLKDALFWRDYYSDQGMRFKNFYFYTHGSPGVVSLPGGDITLQNVARFRRVSRALEINVRILFMGCNIAEGLRGERFLLQFGEKFMGVRGGIIGASDSKTFGEIPKRYWGDLVIVEVDRKGKAKIVKRI